MTKMWIDPLPRGAARRPTLPPWIGTIPRKPLAFRQDFAAERVAAALAFAPSASFGNDRIRAPANHRSAQQVAVRTASARSPFLNLEPGPAWVRHFFAQVGMPWPCRFGLGEKSGDTAARSAKPEDSEPYGFSRSPRLLPSAPWAAPQAAECEVCPPANKPSRPTGAASASATGLAPGGIFTPAVRPHRAALRQTGAPCSTRF